MVYTPDFTLDLERAVYGLETMTLKVEGAADIVLSNCVGDEPHLVHEMEPSDGQVPQFDNMFVWPVYRSPTQPPLGSVLVDAQDIYWTILSIQHRHIVETWRAHCRNLSILPTVANQAVVLRAVYGKGKANEAKAQWHGLFSGKHPYTKEDVIPARFQPSTEDAMLRFGSEWTRETYRVILSQKLPMTLAGGEYRLIDENGNRYRIMHYADEQRLDRLPVCIAVRITEGVEHWHGGTPPGPLPAPVFPTTA